MTVLVAYDALKDKSYAATRLGSSVVSYLAWKELQDAAERTLDQYERDLARAALLFPDLPVEEWGSSQCMFVLQQFPQASRRRVRAVLNDFFRWALSWGHVTESPMVRVPTPKPPAQKLIDMFDDAEEHALCALPEVRDSALMVVLFGTGIRKGEARALTLNDVDMKRGVVRVLKGKGSKGRLIPVGGRVLAAVDELRILEGLNPSDHLWYGVRTNSHYTRYLRVTPAPEGTFHRWWARCLSESGVPYRNPHTTRHTYATKYLRAGGRIEILARLLGHSSVSTTDREYSHLVTEDLTADLLRVLETRGL
jgi:integrase